MKNYQQQDIKMEEMEAYSFLADMYRDAYFPNNVVDMGKNILVKLCLDLGFAQNRK
jgi:hypothetical protein